MGEDKIELRFRFSSKTVNYQDIKAIDYNKVKGGQRMQIVITNGKKIRIWEPIKFRNKSGIYTLYEALTIKFDEWRMKH